MSTAIIGVGYELSVAQQEVIRNSMIAVSDGSTLSDGSTYIWDNTMRFYKGLELEPILSGVWYGPTASGAPLTSIKANSTLEQWYGKRLKKAKLVKGKGRPYLVGEIHQLWEV